VFSNDENVETSIDEPPVENHLKKLLLNKVSQFVNGDGLLSQTGFIQGMEAIGERSANEKGLDATLPVRNITTTLDKLSSCIQCPMQIGHLRGGGGVLLKPKHNIKV
jgi:hypothetical protein